MSENPADFTPNVLDGEVNAMAVVGNRVVIGGDFTQIQNASGGTVYARKYIAAFDATTGAVDVNFHPTLDGAVTSLDTDGSWVYVGGKFKTVNGVAQRGITKISPVNGERNTSFKGALYAHYGYVNAVEVVGSRLYIGGQFNQVSGASRTNLAALYLTTGAAVSSFNLPVNTPRANGGTAAISNMSVSPNGRWLVIAGNFTKVSGGTRNQIAIIDTSANALTSWATERFVPICGKDFQSYVRDIDFAPDGSYFVVVTTGGKVGGSVCDAASRWESGRTGDGQQPTWIDYTGGDSLTAVAVTGATIYVGGHQRWMNNSSGTNSAGVGATDRLGIAALDPVSGMPMSWYPTHGLSQRGVGVGVMVATPNGLWMGYDTEKIGEETHKRVAFFPTAGGATVPHPATPAVPGRVYVSRPNGSIVAYSFNGSSFGPPLTVHGGSVPWGSVNGAFMLGGKVYYTTGNGHLWVAPINDITVGTPVDTSTRPASQDPNDPALLNGIKTMAYDSGKLYYTTGDGKLYYRWFSGESDLVGSQAIVAYNSGFSTETAMFFAGGHRYDVRAGKLYRDGTTLVNQSLDWNVTSTFGYSIDKVSFTRLYGSDRVATSIEVSKDQFQAGKAGAVVLARSDVFADGLAGAALAAKTNAPLLLTASKKLDTRTLAEMKRILPKGKTVYLLGGGAALSVDIARAVLNNGWTMKRLSGKDRYGTALAIAGQLPGANKVLLATGTNFPDALGAGAAAGANNGVVLLTNNDVLPPAVKTYLDGHKSMTVYGVGGPAVRAGWSYITSPSRRLNGTDRYDTAAKLAAVFFPHPAKVGVATGVNFPDGLSGGAYAALNNEPLVLVATIVPQATKQYLTAHKATIDDGAVFGGPSVVSNGVMASAEALVS